MKSPNVFVFAIHNLQIINTINPCCLWELASDPRTPVQKAHKLEIQMERKKPPTMWFLCMLITCFWNHNISAFYRSYNRLCRKQLQSLAIGQTKQTFCMEGGLDWLGLGDPQSQAQEKSTIHDTFYTIHVLKKKKNPNKQKVTFYNLRRFEKLQSQPSFSVLWCDIWFG